MMRRRRKRTRGQSLVEFALLVPVLLLILLLSIDFGRAFYSWVILQNAARIGANYAGLNAQGWEATPDTASIVAEYRALIDNDLDEALCTHPGNPADPVFTDSSDTSGGGQTPDTAYNVGDTAKVALTCVFHPLTPGISAIVSTNVTLGASSEFRIRAGQIAGLNNAPPIPQPSIATPTPIPTATPSPTAGPTATPTGTPGPCTVTIARNPAGNNIKSGVVVLFSATAAGCTITSYSWTFPLGTPGTSTASNPAVTFSTTVQNTTVIVTLNAVTSSGARTDTESFNLQK